MSKITPFLWFDHQAVEAMEFYLSVFENSKELSRMPGPDDTVLVVSFELNGQEIQAMNGGPQYKLTEAFSLSVVVDTQEEIDRLWDSLTADGGEESRCGWLKDKYGLSWQITPKVLLEKMSDPDPEISGKAMQAMLKMKKIVITDLV